MKHSELKFLPELMKNSKISDRELAKAIGVSQPTATRARRQLEKKGYIREYTLIPDFNKIGYELMAFIFLDYRKALNEEEYQRVETEARELERKIPHSTLLIMGGAGIGCQRVVVSLHENYSSLRKFQELIRQTSERPIDDMKTFIAPFEAGRHFQSLTFSMIASYLMSKEKEKTK